MYKYLLHNKKKKLNSEWIVTKTTKRIKHYDEGEKNILYIVYKTIYKRIYKTNMSWSKECLVEMKWNIN